MKRIGRNFCQLEYQNTISRKKEMMVLATIKFNENESDKIQSKRRKVGDITDTTDTTDTVQT
uniref:Uncharacterized protein n=1 Tax=Rhizophagus irregularis (strain DAOM 181602 / DAOM 197198 / MUCL 43194) TaxID=747089 RepID=U9T3Q0_RHIID